MLRLDRQRVLVVGAGKTGLAVARFCLARGASVTLTDRKTEAELMKDLAELPTGVELALGGHREETFTSAQLIVLSPGVPELPALSAARAAGIPITGEVELASRFIEAPIVAITGTNGKSTVTALCGEIARHSGRPVFVGGNLGTPLITCVGTEAARLGGVVVVELSSFQLETCEALRPRAAAILNVTPDHLDRYPGMQGYIAAKLRIAQNMTSDDVLVVNVDDAIVPGEVARGLARLRPWSYSTLRGPWDRGGFVDQGELVLRLASGDPRREERYPISELNLVGRHNQGNALAALLLMRASGLADQAQARAGLKAFQPLPHRMQRVGVRRGVAFFDDSKATNVDSVVAGIDGFPTPFVLIAGGRDKGGSYLPLVTALRQNRCGAVVLIGEAADRIAAAIGNKLPVLRAATMAEAVRSGFERAREGEAVVLSPACSSYDMFDNYEHRGRVFRDCVEELPA